MTEGRWLWQIVAGGGDPALCGALLFKGVKGESGFRGDKASGWHYDLHFVIMSLVILCAGGGQLALMPLSAIPTEVERQWTSGIF